MEALLILLHRKLEGQPHTYFCRESPLGPHFSWTIPAEPYEPANRNRNAANSQQQAVSKSRDVAAQGLLTLNTGIIRRRSRSRSQLSQCHRRRRRGSSSTASISVVEAAITVGEVEENGDMYLDLEDSQVESNTRY
jgi:hypothetical protein